MSETPIACERKPYLVNIILALHENQVDQFYESKELRKQFREPPLRLNRLTLNVLYKDKYEIMDIPKDDIMQVDCTLATNPNMMKPHRSLYAIEHRGETHANPGYVLYVEFYLWVYGTDEQDVANKLDNAVVHYTSDKMERTYEQPINYRIMPVPTP